MSHLPLPDIIITVKDGIDPFGDVLLQARNVFTNHQDKADFLVAEKHEGLLNNFYQLQELGPHPMLPVQTMDVPAEKWKNIRMEVENTGDWVMLFERPDNLYIRGFGNKHAAYELVEKRRAKASTKRDASAVKPVPVMEYVTQLPEKYGCIPLHAWNVSYADLFGVDPNHSNPRDKIESILQEIIEDPTFATRAIKLLSNFQNKQSNIKEEDGGKEKDKEVDKEEKEAKKMLGGIIFLFGENLRMNLRNGKMRYIEKSQVWGEVCYHLLNWRDEGFSGWITQVEPPTNACTQMKKLGINSPEAALELTHLVLNRHVLFQRWVKKDGGGKDPKGGGSKGKDPKRKGDDERGGGKTEGSQSSNTSSFALGGMSSESDSCGRRRVQILDLQTNFSIDWIAFSDWHRPQIIYRKDLLDKEDDYSLDVMTPLVLVGPERPISPYGSLGVEFYPTQAEHAQKKRRTSNERGTLQDVWVVENSSDCDNPTVHKRDIRGEGDHQKLTIHYMVIPNAIEARVTVVLILREDADEYKVSGSIKAWGSEMDRAVKLFSNQTWNVPGGKRFELPLMVSRVCLDNSTGAQLLGVDLDLCVESQSTGQAEYIADWGAYSSFKFPKGFTTQQQDYNGHKVEVSVVLRT